MHAAAAMRPPCAQWCCSYRRRCLDGAPRPGPRWAALLGTAAAALSVGELGGHPHLMQQGLRTQWMPTQIPVGTTRVQWIFRVNQDRSREGESRPVASKQVDEPVGTLGRCRRSAQAPHACTSCSGIRS